MTVNNWNEAWKMPLFSQREAWLCNKKIFSCHISKNSGSSQLRDKKLWLAAQCHCYKDKIQALREAGGSGSQFHSDVLITWGFVMYAEKKIVGAMSNSNKPCMSHTHQEGIVKEQSQMKLNVFLSKINSAGIITLIKLNWLLSRRSSEWTDE